MNWLDRLRSQIGTAVVFLTRMPVRVDTTLPLGDAALGFPLAGALIGGIAALALVAADFVGLPAAVAALVGIGVALAVTGALHEDGLADSADGLFATANRQRALAIMRDSRIGTFGTLALLLAVGLKATALAAIADGAAALVATHALARGWLPVLMRCDEPARADGLAFAAGRPEAAPAYWAAGLGVAIAVLSVGTAGLIAAALSLGCALGVAALAQRRLAGYTGDTLGAAEQAAEIGALLALTALP